MDRPGVPLCLGAVLGALTCSSLLAHDPLLFGSMVRWISNLNAEKLSQIGPFISGISLGLGAIAALLTLFVYNRLTMQQAWLDSFRALNGAFWDSPEMAQVRGWIVCDLAYETKLRGILIKRNASDPFKNPLTEDENALLDKVDRFCAVMVRARSFGNWFMMSRQQRKLWSKLFYYEVLATRNRCELTEYINTHWPEIGTNELQTPALSPSLWRWARLVAHQTVSFASTML